MSVIQLKVKKREPVKNGAKKMRREGLVPGIYYIHGNDSIPIQTDPMSLRNIVYTHTTRIINLEIEGDSENRECVLKDVNFDPVTDKIVHFDLMGIKQDEMVTVEIPINLIGQAIGVRLGGLLQQILHKVEVTCLPKDIPESIDIDITNFKIGHSVSLADTVSGNYEFSIPKETVICSIIPPRVGSEGGDSGAQAKGD